MSTDCWRETGKSGFVTWVGFKNVGIARSTRALSGATGTSDGTGGCSIRRGDALGTTARELDSGVDEATGCEGAPAVATGGAWVGGVLLPQPPSGRTIRSMANARIDRRITGVPPWRGRAPRL